MGPQVRRSINLYILRLIEEDVYIIKLNVVFFLLRNLYKRVALCPF